MTALRLIVLVLFLAGCGGDTPGTPPSSPIVVYAPGESGSEIAALIDTFSSDTGLAVSVKWGSSAELTAAVIGKSGVPADVLITDNAADIWRAAEHGALRPLRSDALQAVPEALQDADAYWTAIDIARVRVIAAPGRTPPTIGSLADLAQTEFGGRLCMSKFSVGANRALLAMLIESHGLKPAERIVRGWMRNLARPPFDEQRELAAAVDSAECELAIVTTDRQFETDADMLSLQPGYFDIFAIGVGRHAANPESAQRFVDWVVARLNWRDSARLAPAATAGYNDEAARLLAERVGYR